MKLRIYLFFLPLLFSTWCSAQVFKWVATSGSTSPSNATSVSIDGNGNVYTAGRFSGTVDFDPGEEKYELTSNGSDDAYVQKLDSLGNLLWAISFGSDLSEEKNFLALDNDGNIYITGKFSNTIDFDPGQNINQVTPKGEDDIYLLKLNTSGNFLWVKTWGANGGYNHGNSISLDEEGNIYIAGRFNSVLDFDPGVGISNLTPDAVDAFILKLNNNGDFVWARSLGGNTYDDAYSIAVDKDMNVYCAGHFTGSVDFDPGNNSYNLTAAGEDAFILKLNSSGDFIWARKFGYINYDHIYGIAVDEFQNVYATGRFGSATDFDPGDATFTLISNGDYDVFVLKLNAAGEFVWATASGSFNTDYGNSIALDTSGNVYTTGIFSGKVDFDPGVGVYNLTSTDNDCFIQKLDNNGNFLWAEKIGAQSSDAGTAIIIDKKNNIYCVGQYGGTVDFYPGTPVLNKTGSFRENFVLKLAACTTSVTFMSITACNSYTSPSGKFTYTTSGSYSDTLVTEMGCDSILLFDLIINYSSESTISPKVCESYTSPSGNYIWNTSGIYYDTLIASNGCDSIITIALTIPEIDPTLTQVGNTLTANDSEVSYQWINCDNENSEIEGATNRDFTPTSSGNYAVKLISDDCYKISNCVTVTVTGTMESNKLTPFNTYPNPTTGVYNIELNELYDELDVKVINSNGELVHMLNLNSTQRISLEIEGPEGIYHVLIRSGDKQAALKVVKH